MSILKKEVTSFRAISFGYISSKKVKFIKKNTRLGDLTQQRLYNLNNKSCDYLTNLHILTEDITFIAHIIICIT